MTKIFNKISRLSIGQELLSLRLSEKLSLARVAQETKLTIDQIKEIERGSGVGMEKFEILAKFYKKQIKVILEDL